MHLKMEKPTNGPKINITAKVISIRDKITTPPNKDLTLLPKHLTNKNQH